MLNKHSFAESVDLCVVVMRSWQAFSQMGIQVSCGQPLFKENCFILCLWCLRAGPIAHLDTQFSNPGKKPGS